MANTEEGEWLEGLDEQSQREEYDRYTANKRALYDFGYLMGLSGSDRVLQSVLEQAFTYDPEKDIFRSRAEYYSGQIIREYIKNAKKEEPF